MSAPVPEANISPDPGALSPPPPPSAAVSVPHAVKPPKGEAQVWLAAMGLSLGVVMVVGLLGLIIVRGFAVFWPNRVVEFTMPEGAKSAPDGLTKFSGEIMAEQKNVATGHTEYLVHMGNKSSSNPGTSYRYVDSTEITSQTTPSGILVAERSGNGDAIFYPVELRPAEGAPVPAADPSFRAKLDERVAANAGLRHDLEKLEKGEIGAINRKIDAHDLNIRAAEKDTSLSEAERTAAVKKETDAKAVLQAEYEKLKEKTRGLQQTLAKDILAIRLSTGEEREQPVGEIWRLYAPNDLGFFGRAGVFFGQLKDFVWENPRESNTEGGIFPALFGTFVMTVLMSLLVTPFGVIAAIYLREYARQGLLVKIVRISVNNLAGVPSIVFGVFGMGFFVYFIGHHVDDWFFSRPLPTPTFGTGGILWASLTLALLTLPVVIVATEEALAAVPRGVREAALACGASKWQTIQRVVLPASAPGVLTGVILAMARGAGEVAPLMLVGVVKSAPTLPLNFEAPFIHAEQKFMHLGFHIFDVGFQSPDSEAAKPMVFATTLLLIILVVVMNLAAILIRNKLRKKYAAGTF